MIDLTEGASGEPACEVESQERAPRILELLPDAVRKELTPRLRGLSTRAVQLLQVAALQGKSFSLKVAAEILGVPLGRLLPPLSEILGAGLVTAAGESLEFRDRAVMEAVYSSVALPVRMAMHRHVGGILLDRGWSAGAAAAHLIVGGRPEDRRDVERLEQAARAVLPSSPQTAAALGLRALELTDRSDELWLSRTATAVHALVAAGRVGEGTELARVALAQRVSAAGHAASLRLTLALVAYVQGRPREAVRETEAVLAQPGLDIDVYTAADITRLLALLAERDFGEIRETAEAVLGGGERPGGDLTLAGALAALGFVAWEEGRVGDALGLVRAAAKRADQGPAEARRMHPRLWHALILTALNDFAAAEAAIAASGEEIEAMADTVWVAAPCVLRSHLNLVAGRLDEAIDAAEAALAKAEELGTRLFVPAALWALTSVALLRGDLTSATRYVERCRREAPAGHVVFGLSRALWIEARLADAQGDVARTTKLLTAILDDGVGRRRLLVEQPAAGAWLARAALAAGDRRTAEAIVGLAEQLATENSRFSPVVAAAVDARGVLDGDVLALEQAAAAHRRPWARASALEDAGVVLATCGDVGSAAVPLESALARYSEAGAARDAARVRARLRELGIRRRHWPGADLWVPLVSVAVDLRATASSQVPKRVRNSELGMDP